MYLKKIGQNSEKPLPRKTCLEMKELSIMCIVKMLEKTETYGLNNKSETSNLGSHRGAVLTAPYLFYL